MHLIQVVIDNPTIYRNEHDQYKIILNAFLSS